MANTALQIDALWAGLNDADTGQSFSGARVAFFESGTTTPKAVWLDADKTLPTSAGLAQTTLDSNGVSQVYGDGKYKINLYAPSDTGLITPLYTFDGVEYITAEGASPFDSIADLRAITYTPVDGQVVNVLGYYAKTENQGWAFQWDATSTDTDDGGMIIKVSAVTTGRWVRLYNGAINIKWMGAVGDGITDDTEAVKAAIQFSKDNTSAHTSVLTYSSRPVIFIPKGVYYCASAISEDTDATLANIQFVGERSIFVANAGITLFGGVGSGVTFKNLQFHAGAVAISIKTANLDASLIDINGCWFDGQTTSSITEDSTSNSTQLYVTRCKFISIQTDPGARIYDGDSGDFTTFESCWGSIRNDAGGAFKSTGKLILKNCLFVPIISLVSWVDSYGTVSIDTCSFGGEFGGADDIIRCYTPPDIVYPIASKGLNIRNSIMFTGGSAIQFYDIPNYVIFKDNVGYQDSLPIYVDASVPTDSIDNIGSTGSYFDIKDTSLQYPDYLDTTLNEIKQSLITCKEQERPINQAPPKITDIINNLQGFSGSYGVSTSGTATLVTTETDRYGSNAYSYTGTADGQNGTIAYTTFLSGLSAGLYTLAIGVEIDAESVIRLTVVASNFQKQFVVQKGNHILNLPFYFDGTGPNTVSVTGSVDNGEAYKVLRHVVYAGLNKVANSRVVMEDTAAPTTGQWYVGDRVLSSTVVVGSPKAWICTVKGIPGTWVSEGNL